MTIDEEENHGALGRLSRMRISCSEQGRMVWSMLDRLPGPAHLAMGPVRPGLHSSSSGVRDLRSYGRPNPRPPHPGHQGRVDVEPRQSPSPLSILQLGPSAQLNQTMPGSNSSRKTPPPIAEARGDGGRGSIGGFLEDASNSQAPPPFLHTRKKPVHSKDCRRFPRPPETRIRTLGHSSALGINSGPDYFHWRKLAHPGGGGFSSAFIWINLRLPGVESVRASLRWARA